MERPILAMTVGVEAFLALFGGLIVVFLIAVADLRSVTEVAALVLLIAVPTAAVGDAFRRDLAELRAADE